jgi:hypothetical protein
VCSVERLLVLNFTSVSTSFVTSDRHQLMTNITIHARLEGLLQNNSDASLTHFAGRCDFPTNDRCIMKDDEKCSSNEVRRSRQISK